MRHQLVAGNWKMHGNMQTVHELLIALSQITWQDNVDIAIFPPALYIDQAIKMLANTPIEIGAQDCAMQSNEGALTGEIAASQLSDIGCKYVLIGHSERRLLLGDTEQTIIKKFAAAKDQGLVPILCVGETEQQRKNDHTFSVITSQLNSIINAFGIDAFINTVIAYEPVWAIGTGVTATPEQAQKVHAFIRSYIANENNELSQKIQIIYGGSVKADNAAQLFAMADIDGGLIGGASLNAKEFSMIYHTAGNK